MEDNLIYNGDFSKGIDSWSGSGISVENGIVTLTGDIIQDAKYLIPISTGNRYKISFDIKFNSVPNDRSFYLALRPYDEDLNAIHHTNVIKIEGSKTNTILSKSVNNGDTTVTIESANGWISDQTYRSIGICDNPKWGYNRCTKYQTIKQNGISGNILTLKDPWNIGSYPEGTKVANFTAGANYIYPISLNNIISLPLNTWQTLSGTFYPRDIEGDRMWGCRYIRISMLGYDMNYSIRNLKMIDENGIQKNIFEDNIITTPHKNGTVTSAFLEQPETSDAKILHYGNLVSSEFKEV